MECSIAIDRGIVVIPENENKASDTDIELAAISDNSEDLIRPALIIQQDVV